MKKVAILLALLVLQMQVTAVAAANSNYNKKSAQKTKATKPVSHVKVNDGYKQDGSDYLLKYNINDLESAPWLNGGKRKI